MKLDALNQLIFFTLHLKKKQVGPKTTPGMTQCLCKHLTDFGGDVMVAPNPIDMGAVFAGLKNLGDNLGVLMVILTIFLVYTLLCVWSKKKDRQDDIDVSLMSS